MRLCIVKRCIVRHCIARYYIAKHCIAKHGIIRRYILRLRITKRWIVVSRNIEMLYRETLYHKTSYRWIIRRYILRLCITKRILHRESLRFCITSYCKILRITRCCIKRRLHCETFDVNSLRNDINDILVRTYIVYACIEVELDRDSIVNEPFAIRLFSLMQCNSAVRDD